VKKWAGNLTAERWSVIVIPDTIFSTIRVPSLEGSKNLELWVSKVVVEMQWMRNHFRRKSKESCLQEVATDLLVQEEI